MIDNKLTLTEQEEASVVLEKYRTKYMCSMGPVLAKIIQDAIESEAGRVRFANATAQFFNSTYFNDPSNEGLPLNTRALLGFDIWQSPCRLERVKRYHDSQILTALFLGVINVVADGDMISKESNLGDFFIRGKDDKNHDVLVYNYAVEGVFSSMEQSFLFLRAFWYYIEARVLLHLVQGSLGEAAMHALESYTDLRRSAISALIHDKFPEQHYYSRIDVSSVSELETFYDKHLFSKLRSIQRKCLLLSKVVSCGHERKVERV